MCVKIVSSHIRGTIRIIATLTKEIIEAAITGFEAQKRHIDAELAELRAML
jgi:hypothetical protein